MLFSRHIFSCNFKTAATLPAFKGSIIRGMLGWALRQTACALRRNDCTTCLLLSRCVYAKAFETIAPQYHHSKKTPPHPYVLEPPLSETREYQADDSFEVALLLFGEMTEYLPYFIYAFEQMGEAGLGSSREQGPAPFTLIRVSCEGDTIYDQASKTLRPLRQPISLHLPPPPTGAECSRLRVSFVTPLRIKHLNTFARELPFHVLVRAMLRRISSMFAQYGDGEPKLDYPGLVQRAQDVSIHSEHLRWKDWTRYSARQQQAMQFGGLVGEIVYEGCLAEYLPLFELCTVLHVGKQSVFGLGQMDYTQEPC